MSSGAPTDAEHAEPAEARCRTCRTTEALTDVWHAGESGPGWIAWYCPTCIQLPPEPDLNSHRLDQLLAAAEGIWEPGAPWPPRP